MKQSKFLQKFFAGRVPLLLTLLAVTLIITALVMPKAFNRGNAQQIMNNLCFACVYGIGVAVLLMGGGFDFAASAHSTVATLVFLRILQSSPNMPWGVAAVAAIIFGAHFRWDYLPFFEILHDYLAAVADELHQRGIKLFDHHSVNLVHRYSTREEMRHVMRDSSVHLPLSPTWEAAASCGAHSRMAASAEGSMAKSSCEAMRTARTMRTGSSW